MIINLSPSRREAPVTLSVTGDVLTIDGVDYDFTAVAEGTWLSMQDAACEWLAADLTRVDGALHLTLILPHGAKAPTETLFPQPIAVTQDGPVFLPDFSIEA